MGFRTKLARVFSGWIFLMTLATYPSAAGAASVSEGPLARVISSYRMDLWSYYSRQVMANHSPYDVGNLLAGVPYSTWALEARPEVSFHWQDEVTGWVRPRAVLTETRQNSGDHRQLLLFYINEWALTARPVESLTLEAGRSSLVWGPAAFRSPSNPFTFDNGRSDPVTELPGKDYAKIGYSFSGHWSVNLLSNFGGGRTVMDKSNFRRTDALKLDYTGDTAVGSLILSKKESRPAVLGAFGQRTVSPSTLVYGEASIGDGDEGLYPQVTTGNPLGRFTQPYLKGGKTFYDALVGSSYTLTTGHVLSLELLVNNTGYNERTSAQFQSVVDASAAHFVTGDPLYLLAGRNLGEALNNNLSLQRRHYLFLQAQNPIGGSYLWNLRYTQNLDDGSGQAAAYVECNAGNRAQVFLLSFLNFGNTHTEFRQVATLVIKTGVHFTF